MTTETGKTEQRAETRNESGGNGGQSTDREPERLGAGYTGRLLASLSLAWATLQVGRFLLSPLLPAIIADLRVSTATAGLALGALQLLYAVTQFPSGRLSDAFSRPPPIVAGLVAICCSFLLFSVATSVVGFVAAALVLGLGKGLFAVPSRAQLSDVFVEKRGQALGVYAAGTDAGGLTASVVGVVVTSGAVAGVTAFTEPPSWRAPFLPLAGLVGLTAVGYVVWNEAPYRVGWPEFGFRATVRRLLTTRAQREALTAFALFFFVVGAWVGFLPTYLATAKGFSEATAAGVFAVVFVVGFAVKPVSGRLADQFPRRAVAVGGLVLSVGALGAVIVLEGLGAVVAAVAVYAVGYKSVFPVVDALLLDAAPDANVGGDLGAARAVFLGVGAFGPVYLGWMADTAGYRVGFLGLAACLLVAAGLLARDLR
ncbi:MFS transporter [Halobaculum sp. MBLA0147]|uniref:MFS transporter n=1 Tax=Halobaculum sp. MBLA0147 TaxID=3079934 RepID=UPI00352551D7